MRGIPFAAGGPKRRDEEAMERHHIRLVSVHGGDPRAATRKNQVRRGVLEADFRFDCRALGRGQGEGV